MKPAGAENLMRLKSALRRDRAAMDALFALGLHGGTIDRLHLGQKQPYVSREDGRQIARAVAYPLLSRHDQPIGRYGYYNLTGITKNPVHPKAWAKGANREYRIGNNKSKFALVCADVVDAWLAWQCYQASADPPLVLSRTRWNGWPGEWRSSAHWAPFDDIVIIDGDGASDFLSEIAPAMAHPLKRLRAAPPFASFADMVRANQTPYIEQLLALEPDIVVAEDTRDTAPVGMFEAAPIDVSSGLAKDCLYYPVAVELRAVEGQTGALVHQYRTMIVRSDGALLSADLLPAPRGTQTNMRVLALSDGTRIRGLPPPSPSGSWSYASIEAFVKWRRGVGPRPFRSLDCLLSEIERYLRHRIWLPDPNSHTLIACFVAMTFAYQLFPALPILLVLGPAASGKSELGEAVASLAANGVLASQLRAAGMVRLLDESRGLLVLDDMDATGALSLDGDGEIAMALKTGYKRSTSRKPLADRGGRVRMVDYFGPKLVTRTRSPGPVLGSRMITVRTRTRPSNRAIAPCPLDDAALAALRDECHCWAMASVTEIRQTYSDIGPGNGQRSDEIAWPLRTIARCAGETFTSRLEQYLVATPE